MKEFAFILTSVVAWLALFRTITLEIAIKRLINRVVEIEGECPGTGYPTCQYGHPTRPDGSHAPSA